MLALEFEQAIRQLEETTEALLVTQTSDLGALCQALERRANAITKVALLAEGAHAGSGSAVERLAAVLVSGEAATRKILHVRREASDEWSRLQQVLRGAGSGDAAASRLECEG